MLAKKKMKIILPHLAILIIPMYFTPISATTNFQISTSNRNLHKNLQDKVHSRKLGEEKYLVTSEENNEYQDSDGYTTFPPDPLSSSGTLSFLSSEARHINRNEEPYITRTKSEWFEKYRNLNKLNRDLYYPNTPSYRRTIYKFRPSLNPMSQNRRYYLDRYFPVLHRHNYRSDYIKSAARPHFYSNYDNANHENSYMDERRLMDNLILKNEIPSTEINSTSNLEYNATSKYDVRPSFLLQPKDAGNSSQHHSETLRRKEYNMSSTTEDQLIFALSRILKEIAESKPYISNINLRNRKMEQDPETLISLLRNNSTRNINFHDYHQESQTSNSSLWNDLSNEKESNAYHSKSIEQLQNDKKETSNVHIVKDKEENFERNLPQYNSIIKYLKLPRSNRVYYEKVPPNLNLSWYVFLNCSRDSCLFTNTTNETALINNGWILHNCTTYGCVEMYPKTESAQKFICLLLLVFSLCILKIVAFVLVFYCCRHIKLSKSGSDNGKSLSWNQLFDIYVRHFLIILSRRNKKNASQRKDEGKQNSPRGHTRPQKDKDSVYAELKQNGDQFLESNSVKVNINSPGSKKKFPSKVWVPPTQNITSCLLLSENTAAVLIPDESYEKSIPVCSENLTEVKKKNRSNIPRLIKRPKSVFRNDATEETRKVEKMTVLKPLKCGVERSEKNEDLLLMSWDDDALTENLYFPSSIEKEPNWVSIEGNESKTFIHLDLNKPESSKT